MSTNEVILKPSQWDDGSYFDFIPIGAILLIIGLRIFFSRILRIFQNNGNENFVNLLKQKKSYANNLITQIMYVIESIMQKITKINWSANN